jgi:aspartyl-tRNA(Asn)/glutamyl-tRNA(Gln) amidotransferase subunit B
VKDEEIERLKRELPELPDAKRERFEREYRLPAYDAALVTASRAAADFFETLVKTSGVETKLCANWQAGELSAALNREGLQIEGSHIDAPALGLLLKRIADGTVSGKMAKEVFDAMWAGEGGADEVIERRGLRQISDSGEIEKLVDEVLAANARQVQDYRAGKEKAFNSLVGQVMKATRGKANPAQVNELLKRKLG